MTRFGKFKKATAVALALVAGFGASAPAQATVLAISVLEVTNFLFKDAVTGAVLDISQFSNPILQDTGTNTAALTGFATQSNTGSVFGGAALDISQACVGAVCPGQNNFGHTVPPPANQFTRADSILNGNPVTGLPGTLGANARTVTEVQLTGSGTGNGDSDLTANDLFTFTLTQARAIRLTFDADLYLRAFLSPDVVIGSSAAATTKLSFSLVNLATGIEVFNWAPNGAAGGIVGGTENLDGGNLQASRTALLPGLDLLVDLPGSQQFDAQTNLLGAGTYQFVISHIVSADGTQIPEPGTMLLAGLGLAGLALSRRRAGKSA